MQEKKACIVTLLIGLSGTDASLFHSKRYLYIILRPATTKQDSSLRTPPLSLALFASYVRSTALCICPSHRVSSSSQARPHPAVRRPLPFPRAGLDCGVSTRFSPSFSSESTRLLPLFSTFPPLTDDHDRLHLLPGFSYLLPAGQALRKGRATHTRTLTPRSPHVQTKRESPSSSFISCHPFHLVAAALRFRAVFHHPSAPQCVEL